MKFEEMYHELERIAQEAYGILHNSGYLDYGECEPEDLQEVYSNPDLLQRYRRMCKGLEMLDQLRLEMEYYRKPVREQGVISFDSESQRYCLNGNGFHCGDGFEVLQQDGFDNSKEWVYTSIESEWEKSEGNPNHEGYYLTNCGKDTEIEGLQARVR